jgi:dTDP-glucose 4,6-dehydratase
VAIGLHLLELAREKKPGVFIQFSTDEVYGAVDLGTSHAEWSTILPSNPYSASKAAQEAIAVAYWRTYGVPLIITNCMNMVGETQEPTKFFPKVIRAVEAGEPVTIHGTPGAIGSRMYLDAKNLAAAWVFLLKNTRPTPYVGEAAGERPDRYNIVGQEEVNNLELAQRIAAIMGKPLKYRYEDFHRTRPGHDRRYALDGGKIAGLGWSHPIAFDDTVRRVVAWSRENPEWLGN